MFASLSNPSSTLYGFNTLSSSILSPCFDLNLIQFISFSIFPISRLVFLFYFFIINFILFLFNLFSALKSATAAASNSDVLSRVDGDEVVGSDHRKPSWGKSQVNFCFGRGDSGYDDVLVTLVVMMMVFDVVVVAAAAFVLPVIIFTML